MPLSWNEIRNRAHAFSLRWADETSERAESQSFWNEFFDIFGVDRRRVASFEKQVQITRAGEKLKNGRIDAFWKGTLLIEHKSADQDLDRAFAQAIDYFDGLPERDLPRYILVSDFKRFHLYDLESGSEIELALNNLHKHIKHFAFIAGYRTQEIAPQNPVNLKAAERMGALHDRLKESGYTGHQLELLLVRLLFCLFAEDTGIIQPASAFRLWLEERTSVDGTDLGPQLALLFQVLNTPEEKRSTTLDESLAAFPYINGRLFEEPLPIAAFDRGMRDALLECCALDWSAISPAIFGALFQSIMDQKARRNLGAHYTSEENILKLIKPLFLDDLWDEFHRIKGNRNRLLDFHKKLRGLTFFDPACGCGNFLVIAYRELRKLELELLRATSKNTQQVFDVHQLIMVDVDQFYGIEIEEFPAQIAQVALWLIDHQMNVRVSEQFGLYFARIPLRTTPHIIHGNALALDWNGVLPAEHATFVFGNPPFKGKHYQSKHQKTELIETFAGVRSASDLDYVSGWYVKAARYIQGLPVRCAFVSTNSITQGEQVSILWNELLHKYHLKIHFAHRTFKWSNEGSGQAAVHCVIIGFAAFDASEKKLFVYDDINGEPHEVKVANISPYLTPGPDFIVAKHQTPLANVPIMRCGNKPSDGGHLLLTDEERDELLAAEPAAAPFLKRFVGADEYINNTSRWCLWFADMNVPAALRSMPQVMERLERVKAFRAASSAEPTRRAANTPTQFFFVSQPQNDYILVPEVSSERRRYVPIGLMSKDVISSNKNYLIAEPNLFLLGVLQSEMHMAWMRQVAGRLESRYQYSATMVYNTFPWPDEPNDKRRAAIETTAQEVLDVRAQFPESSLADLYDPLTMPPALLKAHQKLDAAVDAAYGRKGFANDAERVAFLLERYQKLTSLFPTKQPSNPKARKKSRT